MEYYRYIIKLLRCISLASILCFLIVFAEAQIVVPVSEFGSNVFEVSDAGGYCEEHNGGRDRNSVLADIFEAFIGAISEDCGIEYVLKILDMTIYKHVEDVNYDDITDFKTKLQELIQADQRKTVTYSLLSTTGPANAPEFEVAVMMDDMTLGTGKGSSKKRAEQKAAKDALKKLAR